MPPPPTMPPKPAMPPKPIAMPPRPSPGMTRLPAKTFSVQTWSSAGEGEKILIYSNFGMGKSTLASMAPDPIFIGLDDGGRKIRNPKTGKELQYIPGVESFQDLRDVLHQPGLFSAGQSIVLDTITMADTLGEKYTFANVKKDNGEVATSIEAYGYGKGYRLQTETMRLLLADFDPLVRAGINVILLAQQGQATVSNLEGTDYLEDGPLLNAQPKAGPNVRQEICAWVDHVFRIGHGDISVLKANKQATKGKVSGSTERVIYTTKQLHYVAKSRPLKNGTILPAAVSFDKQDDASLWEYIFA